MSYDVENTLSSYKSVFDGYLSEIIAIKTNLESFYNFGISPTETNYNDFWKIIISSSIINSKDFSNYYELIISKNQEANDLVSESFMNMLGMISTLDNYLCYASDALSRSIDVTWGFGKGTIYGNVSGVDDVLVKKGLVYYKSEISKIIGNLNTSLVNMDSNKYNDEEYLINQRDNIFIPEIIKINDILDEVEEEFAKLVELSTRNLDNLTVWLPTCFRLLTTVSLTFNLGTKILKISDKGLLSGSPLNTETKIGISVAKYWKKQVTADFSNRGDCMTEAIIQGLNSIPQTGFIESFIDLTWDEFVPKS